MISECFHRKILLLLVLRDGTNSHRAGSYYSTVNDFMILGKAILTSQLLPKSLTYRWLKPTSFVEDFAQGVGRPWEIYRLKVNGQSVDLYTKGGDCK